MKETQFEPRVARFLMEEVDTVPQIEALLLLWESRPRQWTAEELGRRLYVPVEALPSILEPLARRHWIWSGSGEYSYQPHGPEADGLVEAVATAYRRDLVGATTIIHNKASAGIREFARAFKLKKEGR